MVHTSSFSAEAAPNSSSGSAPRPRSREAMTLPTQCVPETSPCRRAVHSIRWGRCPGSGSARPPGRCGGSQSSHVCQRIRTGVQSKSDGVRDFATDERSGSEPNSFRSSAWSPVMCPSSANGSPGRSVVRDYGSFIVVLLIVDSQSVAAMFVVTMPGTSCRRRPAASATDGTPTGRSWLRGWRGPSWSRSSRCDAASNASPARGSAASNSPLR